LSFFCCCVSGGATSYANKRKVFPLKKEKFFKKKLTSEKTTFSVLFYIFIADACSNIAIAPSSAKKKEIKYLFLF
jgi:amino acid transporter